MNRGWRFCRPLPYHLATAPIGPEIELTGEFRRRLSTRRTAATGRIVDVQHDFHALTTATRTSLDTRSLMLGDSESRAVERASKRPRNEAHPGGPTGPTLLQRAERSRLRRGFGAQGRRRSAGVVKRAGAATGLIFQPVGRGAESPTQRRRSGAPRSGHRPRRFKIGAGNGIRTRDFDLGKVALYH